MAIVNTPMRKTPLPAVITTRIDEVRRREARLTLVAGLLDALAIFLAAVAVALVVDWTFTLFSTQVRAALTVIALCAGLFGLVVLAVLPRLKRRTLADVASTVDRSIPELEERWETVTRLSTSSEPETITGSRVLLDRVVAESVDRNRLVDPESIVPDRRLRKHQVFLASAVAVLLALFLIDPAQTWVLLRRFCAPASPISLTQIAAPSGDLAVARGEPVRLEATLAGRSREKAELYLRTAQGEVTTRTLSPSDEAGTRFSHAIEEVNEPFAYLFRAGDGETGWFNVETYDRPRLVNVELKLVPPAYTRLPTISKSELPTSLRAVEGSRLEVAFSVDQPLDHFDLQLGSDSSERLTAQKEVPQRYVFQTKLEKTLRLTPVFASRHGLTNLRPPSCQIIVYADRAPDVAIISPEREISLRPNDQLTIEFAARDDFGVMRAEIVAFTGDQPDLQNARMLPAQPPSGAKNSKTARGAKDPAKAAGGLSPPTAAGEQSSKEKAGPPSKPGQPDSADTKPETAETKPSAGTKPSADTKPGTDAKAIAANAAASPSQTVVMPIPLGAQTGEKNVRAKVKLDLRQFQLKQGQQLQYIVRVYDSRRAPSAGQSYGEPSNSQDSKSSPALADSGSKQPSNGSPSAAKEGGKQMPPSAGKEGKTARKDGPKNQVAQSSSKSASAASRKNAAKKTRPDGKAKTETAKNEAAKINTAQPRSSEQAESPSSESKDGKEAASAENSKGERTGAPRPPDSMTRRQLDVDSQSAVSSTMKINIDKWAGSFDGQQRRKLEILIDPVLKELDATLAKAADELRDPSETLNQGKKPGPDFLKSLRAADTQIAHGQSLVADLVQKSEGTPYAFIGLLLVDITELHISPARLDVKTARNETPDRKDRLQQATVHLIRAREMLADLTRKYQSVKRDLQLAEDMQRIKAMYQVFIEDAMIFMAANRPELNPKNRKMAQLELDEEFMKQYRELAQEWERTLAELAKALAKDPRLLARYMNLSRRRVDSLRDQLTLLNLRQQELLVPVERLTGEKAEGAPAKTGVAKPSPFGEVADPELIRRTMSPKQQAAAGQQAVRASLSEDLAAIASGTIRIQEDLGTWLPQKMKEEARLSLREQTARLSSLATLAATATRRADDPKNAAAAKLVGELAGQLKSFEAAMVQLAKSPDAQVALPVNRRLAQVRKLQQATTTWVEKNGHVAAGRFNRALEVDQHRLSEETLELAGKLETAGAQLAGLPDEVISMADEVKDAVRYDVLVEQMSAELRLRDGNLAEAKTHQKKAIEGFTRAEERFNKLIDRVIAEQDKVPPQVPDLDNMQLPTLEDLLARLENEADLAELLGIPNRPSNLQGLRDWMPSSSSGSGGMMAGAQGQAQAVDRARQDALRAAKKLAKTNARPSRPMAAAAHWNTLGSRLEDAVRQGRGNTPPRQYRRAIERYFELISGAQNVAENAPPAAPQKDMKNEKEQPSAGSSGNNP